MSEYFFQEQPFSVVMEEIANSEDAGYSGPKISDRQVWANIVDSDQTASIGAI